MTFDVDRESRAFSQSQEDSTKGTSRLGLDPTRQGQRVSLQPTRCIFEGDAKSVGLSFSD